jgi:site-specific recombinase XerD
VVRQHRLSYDAFIAVCQQVRLKLKMEKPRKERRLPELLSLAELKKFFKTVQKCGDAYLPDRAGAH